MSTQSMEDFEENMLHAILSILGNINSRMAARIVDKLHEDIVKTSPSVLREFQKNLRCLQQVQHSSDKIVEEISSRYNKASPNRIQSMLVSHGIRQLVKKEGLAKTQIFVARNLYLAAKGNEK